MKYIERKELAQKLVNEDKYIEAIREYALLYKEDPKDIENIEAFRFLFSRIIEGNYDFKPETAEEFTMRGTSRFYMGEIENSILDYNEALRLDSSYHYALKSRAFSLKYLDRIDEAVKDLNQAISIFPTGEYYDDLAELYLILNRTDEALNYNQKAVEISPSETRLWYNYGINLAENGKLKLAIEMFDKAIELWPEYDDAIVNRNCVINHLKK